MIDKKSFKAEKHLQSYLDPWDTTSVNPIIPDGKTGMSCGVRFNSAKAVDISQKGELYMAIFPGLNSGAVWIDSQLVRSDFKGPEEYTSTQDNALDEGLINNTPLSFDRRLWTNRDNGFFTVFPGGPLTTNRYRQPPERTIAKWRMVSQGVKISYIGNMTKDDGWFEAIRVPVVTFLAETKDGVNKGTNWETPPGPNWIDQKQSGDMPAHTAPNLMNPYFANINFANHPSYVHDKLKNIHKYRFDLAPMGTNHAWANMEEEIEAYKDFATPGEFLLRNQKIMQFAEQTVDPSYDMILIKIHGRKIKYNPTIPSSLYQCTRLLVHCVQNQEIIFADASISARLHDSAQAVPDKVMKDATIAKGQALQKAATPVKGLKTIVSNIFKKRNKVTDPNDPDARASKRYKVTSVEPDDAPSSSHGTKRTAESERPDYTNRQPKKKRRKGD